MRTTIGLAVLGGAFVLALSACAETSGDVSAVGPTSVSTIDGRRVEGPYVQAGARVRVRVDQPLDTELSPRGMPFIARTVDELRAPDGTVVVPVGSVVRARLVSTGTALEPKLEVRFDTIDTLGGDAAFKADILHAQHSTYPGPTGITPVEAPTFTDSFVYSPDFFEYGNGAAVGAARADSPQETFQPREIHVPRGAELTLIVTRAIIPPGIHVKPNAK